MFANGNLFCFKKLGSISKTLKRKQVQFFSLEKIWTKNNTQVENSVHHYRKKAKPTSKIRIFRI